MHGDSDNSSPRPLFLTTRWTTVLKAGNQALPGSREAMESLCQTYWYPVYAFVRGSGRSPADAQDLTQEFFVRFLEKDFLRLVSPEKGRFRAFLRTALKRFLINEWERARAQKRGGGATHVSFDTALAEERLGREQTGMTAPDHAYDRRWALALLDDATARLEKEYRELGKADLWRLLHPWLTADRGAIDYRQIAAALGVTESASRVAVHRFRNRFRDVFRQALADTVDTPEEIEQELRLVLEILGEG